MTVTLQEAINAIQDGDLTGGKTLLAKLLQQEPSNEAAWIWMSGTVEDIDQRRYCLEKVLEINPANATAKAGLARLGFELPTTTPPTPLARRDHGLGQPASDVESAQPSTPAFVWPEQEESPDESTIVEETFIGDIVAAMNKEEPTEQPAVDTDLDWLFPEEDAAHAAAEAGQASEEERRYMLSDVGQEASATVDTTKGQATSDQSPVEAHPEPSGAAPAEEGSAEESLVPPFAGLSPDEVAALTAASTPVAGQLWRHPDERSHQLTLLTDRYLITAKPDPKHLSEIETILQTGQLPRRLLGHGAKTIPVERITSLQANPNSPTLQVNYLRNNDPRKQNFTLADIAQRDEVVEAFKARQGAQFQETIKTASLWDTLFVPGLTLVVLALITGLLYFWAMDLLINPHSLAQWLPDSVTTWLSSDGAVNFPLYVVIAGGTLMILVMLWLLVNIRKPRRNLVLERKPE
jgi:hypothetical protein